MDPFQTILYELGGEPTAGEGGQPDPAADPAPPADDWAPPTREEWELMNERNQRLELLEQGQGFQPQGFEPDDELGDEPDLDPFADNYGDQLRQLIHSEWQGLQQQQQQSTEAMERAKDVLHDVCSRDGEFLNPEVSEERALALANEILPEFAGRYGMSPRAAEAAIAKAAQMVRDQEAAIGKAYHEREMNQLQQLGQARREPGAAGAQGGQGSAAPIAKGGEMSVVAHHFGQGTGR